MFKPVPKPESKLARYRLLAPSASVRVSPLCFGAMNLGTAWAAGMGTMDKETGFKLLDTFYEAGGNFIDTSGNYQNEESELWLGEWMEKKGIRDEMVIATKFSSSYKTTLKGHQVNYSGNSIKNLHNSVRDSCKKLKTDYIDLLYIHWWDYTCSVEEMMQGLDVMVKSGQVLYLGISDAPAFIVSKANQYARDHGMRQFSVYQGRWAPSFRDLERDVIPMCKLEGMAICPWGALGGGNYKTKAQREEMEKNNDKGRNFRPVSDTDTAMSAVLEKIGGELDLSITGVALAYVMQKTPYVYPIVGGRKVEHLMDNIKAIGTKLSEEHLKQIEDAVPFDIGFPHSFIGHHPRDNMLVTSAAYHDWVDEVGSIHF